MGKLQIIVDSAGNKIVMIPDIIFSNKQNIEWKDVKSYLGKYVGETVEMTQTGDMIYIGKKFPDEYASSKYTRRAKGARVKAKANAVQGVREMIEIAIEKTFHKNHKEKHSSDAACGWYYYTTRLHYQYMIMKRKQGITMCTTDVWL